MNLRPSGRRIGDDVLLAAMQTRVSGPHAPRPVSVQRSPSAYATSCPLEDIAVMFDDGTRLELVLKDLNPSTLDERARRVKPAFLIDPLREIAVYQTILMPRGIGARVYGASAPNAPDAPWLLLEKVAGVELYQVGDRDGWIAAAGWLAGFHDSCPSPERLSRSAHLIDYTAQFYRRWLDRALTFFRAEHPPSRHGKAGLNWIASRFDRIVERLRSWPAAVIHGECYASNVLAHHDGQKWRACPIDWEMAALGPAILDLAAITSGNWSDEDRRRIIAGYVSARGGHRASLGETIEAVDYAQIYLAVQWLGWFGRRRAPAEHARDWLADAIAGAERVGL